MAKEIKFRVKLNIDGKDFDIRNKSRIFANENPMWERGPPSLPWLSKLYCECSLDFPNPK